MRAQDSWLYRWRNIDGKRSKDVFQLILKATKDGMRRRDHGDRGCRHLRSGKAENQKPALNKLDVPPIILGKTECTDSPMIGGYIVLNWFFVDDSRLYRHHK